MTNNVSPAPETMQAVCIRHPGGPEVLQLSELPCPQPAADEIRIKVAAAGVNRPDCLQRRGNYPPPPGASELPGLEVAGIVVDGDTTRWPSGTPVCALLAGGGYAEYVTVPVEQCLPVPAGMRLSAAAALPEALFTVWTNLFDSAQLKAGESVLIHGGASGIGSTAIQLAAARGATVCATAGGERKTALCRELGARIAVDYKNQDFLEVLRAKCDGVDVVLDIVGGSYLESNIKLLRSHGRLVTIGILGGAKGTLNLGLVISKQLKIIGSTLRSRPPAVKGEIARALQAEVWPLLEQGRIKPMVAEELPLAEAARAHELLEQNAVAGKIVLIVDAELAATCGPQPAAGA